MSTFQKATLLLLSLILVAILALVGVLLTRPTVSDILAVNAVSQTAGALQGATNASIEFGNALASATALFATETEAASQSIFSTTTWVVEQNMTVEAQLALTATSRAVSVSATQTAGAGG